MRYLVPLDGSNLSEAVLPWVRLLATMPDSTVELMRCYRPLEAVHATTKLELAAEDDEGGCKLAVSIESDLERIGKTLPAARVETSPLMGSAADSILARSEEADLVVMASHGETGLTRWLMGSITTKVVRASRTPVMVVTANPEAPERVPKLDTIMVPLDGSRLAEVALREAVPLARHFGAKLVLYEGVTYRESSKEEDDWQVLLAKGYLREVAENLFGLEVERVVHECPHGHCILEQSEALKADLIVMGSHGRSGVSRWFLGSVAESVVQRSACPVMIVYDR